MKLFFYNFMRYLGWFLEDIHDLFCKDKSNFYPSSKWEFLHAQEVYRRSKKNAEWTPEEIIRINEEI